MIDPEHEAKKLQNGTIYHYTNITCLENIIKSGELWVSERKFLNDKKELFHSGDIIKKIIENKNIDINIWDNIPEALKYIINRATFYIFSTSLDRDNQELCERYGSARIGFNINKLRKVLNDHRYLFEDSEVIYDKKNKYSNFEKKIEYLVKNQSNFSISNDERYINMFVEFGNIIGRACYHKIEKDSDTGTNWMDEHEYRVVFMPVFKTNQPIQSFYKDAREYIKVDWRLIEADCPIEEIILSQARQEEIIKLEKLVNPYDIPVNVI